MEKQKAEVGVPRRASLTPELRSIDEKNRTIEFVASTEAVDRYGDVIRVGGWKVDNYRKNPVFLFNHKSGEPPIGKCIDLRIESNPPALVQTIQFADAATYSFADTIFKLYAGGFLRAVSVGFMPTEQPVPFTDLEGNFLGYEFCGQELLELSAVQIPANPEALARAVTKGFAEGDLERVFGKQENGTPDSFAAFREEIAELKEQIATLAAELKLRKIVKREKQESDICTLESLVDAVKRAGATVQEKENSLTSDEAGDITTLEELGEAF